MGGKKVVRTVSLGEDLELMGEGEVNSHYGEGGRNGPYGTGPRRERKKPPPPGRGIKVSIPQSLRPNALTRLPQMPEEIYAQAQRSPTARPKAPRVPATDGE